MGEKAAGFDPGTGWQYSNTNYVIAGRIVEQVSGMALIDLLEKRIFLPLRHGERLRLGCQPAAGNRPDRLRAPRLGPTAPFAAGRALIGCCCR